MKCVKDEKYGYCVWKFDDGVEVHEAGFDSDFNYDLCKLNVWVNNGQTYAGSIFPATIEDEKKCFADLDVGSNPIADKWDDGNGNTCNANGWGLNYIIDIKVDDYGNRWENRPAFADWKDAVADFRRQAEADGIKLCDTDKVYVVSGTYLGTRVWGINNCYGTEVTMNTLNNGPVLDWWDKAWDFPVSAEYSTEKRNQEVNVERDTESEEEFAR